MPGRKKHTNPVLILLSILLCLFSGFLFRQSSADPLPAELQRMPDSIVADGKGVSSVASAGGLNRTEAEDTFTSSESLPAEETPETSPTPSETDAAANAAEDSKTAEEKADPGADSEKTEDAAAPADSESAEKTAEPSASPAPTQKPKDDKPEAKGFEVSPEASKGVWTASGSSWMFLVDGTPYTGWLTDTDGKRYFFSKKGIMWTGWLDRGSKRYYLDLDGIMQTGKVVIDGKTYEFLEDGSLKDYTPPEKEEKSETKKDSASPKTASGKTAEKKKKGSVALTFDDGPSSFTDRLLDCLEKNNAKATFFMVGQEIVNFPEPLKRMEALGCELGNHSYTHQDLTALDSAGIAEELNKTDALITEQTGHNAAVVRPPYGSINDTVSSSIPVPMILWSIDTLDWESQDAKKIVKAVMDEVSDGSVILMHDIYSTSVDAAEILIPKLIEEGYELVTVHELAAAHNMELHAGVAYGAMTGK